MKTMRTYWILAVIPAFVLGASADRAFNHSAASSHTTVDDRTDLAGIERLHKQDERITVLNDPKALQAEWTEVCSAQDIERPREAPLKNCTASFRESFIARAAANGSLRA